MLQIKGGWETWQLNAPPISRLDTVLEEKNNAVKDNVRAIDKIEIGMVG